MAPVDDIFIPPVFGITKNRVGDFSAIYHSLAMLWENAEANYYYSSFMPEKDYWKSKYILANIPKRYWQYEYKHIVENWSFGGEKAIQQYRDYWKNFKTYLSKGMGLWLHGDYGCAKTTASIVLGKACMDSLHSVFFWNSKQLLDFSKNAWHDEDKKNLFSYVFRKIDLLIIDDVFASIEKQGVSKDPQTEADLIERIFIERCDSCLPTIFTANHTIDYNAKTHLISGAMLSRMKGSLIEIEAKTERDLRATEDD